MDQHNGILSTLKQVVGQAEKQGSSWDLQEVIDVIETYAEEVGGSEVEEIEVLEYMVHGIGPLVRRTKNTGNIRREKSFHS